MRPTLKITSSSGSIHARIRPVSIENFGITVWAAADGSSSLVI